MSATDQQPAPDAPVTLREITPETVQYVIALKVRPEQASYIAPNSVSIAEARQHQEAWIRAICADELPVGLVMLHDENLRDDPEVEDFYALWRFMIDAEHQGKGYGARAMALIVEHVAANPRATELFTSYVSGEHSPEGFYLNVGFEHTGRQVHGETEMRLELRPCGPKPRELL